MGEKRYEECQVFPFNSAVSVVVDIQCQMSDYCDSVYNILNYSISI